MANFTANYNLKKPIDDEFFDIEDFNGNLEIIDGVLKSNADSIAQNASDRASGDSALQDQIDSLTFDQLILENQTMDEGLLLGDCISFDGLKWVKSVAPDGIYLGSNIAAISGFITLGGFSLEAGYTYYAQVDGSIGLGITSYPVGKAVGVNQLILDFNPKATNPKIYTENMVQFVAISGSTGTIRLKVEKPVLADGVYIYRGENPYAGEVMGTWGTLVADITDDTDYKVDNGWFVDTDLTDETTYYYKAFVYIGELVNNVIGANEVSARAGLMGCEINFEEITGNVLEDTAGNNPATLDSQIIQEGFIGNELSSNGSGFSELDSEVDLHDKTISCWININGNNSAFFGHTSGNSRMFAIYQNGSLRVGYRSTSDLSYKTIDVELSDGWYHIAVLYKSTDEIDLYIDGGFVGSNTFISTTRYINALGRSGYPGYSLDGAIDQFRIFDALLTLDEINDLYNGGAGC